MSRLVIYHGNCYDGVTAAWVCYQKFWDDAEYLPMNYSDTPPDVKGKDVIIVDFSFKRDITLKMKKEAKSLLILDHHKTAQKELKGLAYAIFDMERSGAGIAWDHYFGNHHPQMDNRPDLVRYVEDRDLWRFSLPSSREVNAWIQSFDIDLKVWIEEVAPGTDRPLIDIINEGKSLLRQQTKLVKSICEHAKLKIITIPRKERESYTGPYVQTSILMSEVCEQLLKDYPDYPFSYYSFERKDDKTQYGLRSRADSSFDVSIIAKEFGGGGHKNAAGFEI